MRLIIKLLITFICSLNFLTGCSTNISKKDSYKNINGDYRIYSFFIKGKELEVNWDQSFYELTQKDASNITDKISSCYFRTNLIKPDYALTKKLLEEAALKGNENAQMDLGLIYVCKIYNDKVLENNIEKALGYFYPLAKNGFVDAQLKIAEIYLSSYFLNHNIEAHDASQYWFKKAADAGNYTGLLGLSLLKGNKLKIDDNIKLAAESGNPVAQFILSTMYIYGVDSNKRDYNKAKFWLERTNPKANMYENKLLLMAINHVGGYGIKSDQAKAINHFKDLSQELLPKKVYQFISSLPKDKIVKIVGQLSNELIEGIHTSGLRAEVRAGFTMNLINALKAVTDIEAYYIVISIQSKNPKL